MDWNSMDTCTHTDVMVVRVDHKVLLKFTVVLCKIDSHVLLVQWVHVNPDGGRGR